jgi:hypothetical protein
MTTRKVAVFPSGIRCVVKWSRSGESWHKYVIIPRRVLLERVRALRRAGRRWASIEWWELLPEDVPFNSCGDGGAGQAFAGEPIRQRSSRRFHVYYQNGGWDV